MVGRNPSVLKTSINIITTAATPTFRAPTSRTSEGRLGDQAAHFGRAAAEQLAVSSFLTGHHPAGLFRRYRRHHFGAEFETFAERLLTNFDWALSRAH
jgi:hypothetical protein